MTNQKFISKWEKRRKIGLLKYTLLFGITIPIAGLFGGIIGTVISQGDVCRFLNNTLFGIILLFVTGLGIGMLDWHRNESKYKTHNGNA